MINENTKRQLTLYILGLNDLPEYVPKHIENAAHASKIFFESLNDNSKTPGEIFYALEVKHKMARNFAIIEETPWLW
jgi:hypothetical protein